VGDTILIKPDSSTLEHLHFCGYVIGGKNCDSPSITEPTNKTTYIQYTTISANKFIIPSFGGGNISGPITYSLTGTNASSLTIAKVATNDWIVTPFSTLTDDVTYTFKVKVTDGCNIFDSMSSSFVLHVGCPAAASSDSFTFVDNLPINTTLMLY